MRHLSYIFRTAIIFMSALTAVSCVYKETPIMEQGGDAYIKTDIVTYSPASEDPYALGPAEYVIRRCRLYAFDGDILDNMIYSENVTSDNLGAYAATMKVTQTTGKKLYCIINEPDDPEIHSRLSLINRPEAFAQIEYEIADYVTAGYNSDASFGGTDFCLPAFGETAEFSTKTLTPETPISVKIKTTRSLARVDIMVQKLSTVSSDVKITSSTGLSTINTREKGFLSPTQTPSGSLVTKTVSGPTTSLTVPVRNASDNAAAVRAYTFYTPERDCSAAADKLKFQLTDVDFGGSPKTYDEVTIDNDTDPKLTKIERGKLYRIYCTFTPQGNTINLKILDWDDVPVTGDIYGDDFNVSSSKILIPVIEGVGSSKTINLNASENITFIEYEYKGNKGDATILPAGLTVTGIGTFNGTTDTGSLTFTSGSTSAATAPVYLWFQAGNIKKRIEVDCLEYYFSVTPPADFPYTGGTKQYKVTSYSKLGGGSAVPWTATEYSTDGGTTWTTKPSWITSFSESETGSTSNQEYSVTIAQQVGSYPHNDALKAKSAVSGYDLSRGGETANCYIVNRPGTYSLPLVYGNARRADGSANTSAYTSGVSGTNVLQNFIKHDGNAINSPYISGATTAVLIWQDAKDLVKVDAALTGAYPNQKLTFTVPEANICQGNAVVAVTDGTDILWSWHIWVTDYVLGTDDRKFTNATSKDYYFMPYNLGWCDGPFYPARSVKVRLTQNGSGIQKVIDFNQSEAQELGNSPYYQWGRKDPFIAGIYVNSSNQIINKTWYDANEVEKINTKPNIPSPAWQATNGNNIIKNSILNPDKFCVVNSYARYIYYNLWSAENMGYTANDDAVTKTVYDPSPVDYHLPASNAFSGFTISGVNTSNLTSINGTWDINSRSWNFVKDGNTINFTAAGYRDPSSESCEVGGEGHYWSAIPSVQINQRTLSFNSHYVAPYDCHSPEYGFSVRCVKD